MPTSQSNEPMELAEDTGESPVRSKIEFDLDALDEQGFIGPADGKRPIDYEFKIPKSTEYQKEVSTIDPSVKFMPGSRGRIGATKDEILCIGSTFKQPRYKEILLALAELPYIERIIVCYYE